MTMGFCEKCQEDTPASGVGLGWSEEDKPWQEADYWFICNKCVEAAGYTKDAGTRED